MDMFVPEELPLLSCEPVRHLEQTFIQKPTRLPLNVPLYPTHVAKQETNWVPIVAVVSFFGFLAFLGFLAYMRKP